MKKIINNKGITLVALVITIVILLILAGLSINFTIGENGIITKTKEASEKYQNASIDEEEKIQDLEETVNSINIPKVIDKNPGELEKESENVFVINSIEDFVFFSYDVRNGNNYEGKTVKLGYSLDFCSNKSYVDAFRTDYGKYGYDRKLKEELISNIGWISIGDTINIAQNNFKGIFDGENKDIYNLRINKKNIEEIMYIGLFANNQGTIKNLNLKNTKIYTESNDEVYCFIAGITGNNEGTITNCTVEGKHQSKGSYALIAGIAGRNQGSIENCISKSNILGEAMYMSGIVAQNLAKVNKCGNEGEINNDNGRYVGGITGLGYLNDACVENSYNKGNIFVVTKESAHIGGITGQAQFEIKNCYNVGKICVSIEDSQNICDVGGIVGTEVSELTNCYNKGVIELKNYNLELSVGGIIGKFHQFAVSNVYSETEITLNESNSINKGLLIGFVWNDANIMNIKNLYFYGKENAIGKDLSGKDIPYVNLEKKTDYLKILEIVNLDDENKFVEDTNNINGGYPILNWEKNF